MNIGWCFLIYILKAVLVTFLIAALLDGLYTYAFLKSKNRFYKEQVIEEIEEVDEIIID